MNKSVLNLKLAFFFLLFLGDFIFLSNNIYRRMSKMTEKYIRETNGETKKDKNVNAT